MQYLNTLFLTQWVCSMGAPKHYHNTNNIKHFHRSALCVVLPGWQKVVGFRELAKEIAISIKCTLYVMQSSLGLALKSELIPSNEIMSCGLMWDWKYRLKHPPVWQIYKKIQRFLNPVRHLIKIEWFVAWQVDLEKVLCITVIPLHVLILTQGVIEWINRVVTVLQSSILLRNKLAVLKIKFNFIRILI